VTFGRRLYNAKRQRLINYSRTNRRKQYQKLFFGSNTVARDYHIMCGSPGGARQPGPWPPRQTKTVRMQGLTESNRAMRDPLRSGQRKLVTKLLHNEVIKSARQFGFHLQYHLLSSI